MRKALTEKEPRGGAMFPDAAKTNQELGDLLAYLALLRMRGFR